MYPDKTLTPKEAIRLCALGVLSEGPRAYGDLARAIRHFVDHVVGPTTDIMGHSIEHLKYEGLVESSEDAGDEAVLQLSPKGSIAMHQLLTANIRTGASELNKLVIALKFRFLNQLETEERLDQIDLLMHALDRESARLVELRGHHAQSPGNLVQWLDHDIGMLDQRLAWLSRFRAQLTA